MIFTMPTTVTGLKFIAMSASEKQCVMRNAQWLRNFDARGDQGDKIIGCVAYHKHDNNRCEMKRLFVREGYRKHRAGSKLVESIINFARADGFSEIVLDTITPLESAIRLYKKFGFVECAPYYENPMSDVIYMKKILSEE